MCYSRVVELGVSSMDVFGNLPGCASIFVPDDPFPVRNNCQTGQWNLNGTKDLGSKVSMRVLKFARYFGSLGQTQNEFWGQLWFVAEPGGDIPANIVALTYIKTRSLSNFLTLVNLLKAKGINPACGIFTPTFVKQTRSIIDSNGNLLQGNYYYLDWHWQDDSKSAYTTEQLVEAIAAVANHQDLVGTARMINFDVLSTEEKLALTSSIRPNLLPHSS